MPTIDTSQNYLLALDTEVVTYLRKTGQGSFAAPLTVESCKRRAVTKADVEDDDALVGVGLVWHLWLDRLAAAAFPEAPPEPARGDVIEVSAAEGYVVRKVEVQSLGQRYRLTTARRGGE